jgi:hypothetical protein
MIIDNDLDIFLEKYDAVAGNVKLYFLVPNKAGCHEDCDGCHEPGKSDKCLRCKKGYRKVEGKCLPISTPCPPNMQENAIKQCQRCDKNDPWKSNCDLCELSSTNSCLKCGPFSKANVDFPPVCGCTGMSVTTING